MKYICIGPRCWGKAETTGGAIRNAKRAYPTFSLAKHMPYDLYEVQDDDFVDEAGNICAHTPPKKIREVRWTGNQRIVKEKFDAQVSAV